MSGHVKIITYRAIVINRMAQILEEEGIGSIIRNNVESVRLAGFGSLPQDVDLLVAESDLEKAQEIINKSN